MATISFKNGDDYLFRISKLEASLQDEVCGEAIFGATKIVTDAVRREIEALPTDESYGTEENPTRGPKRLQVDGLLRGLGIASMQNDGGFLNVKIGFKGYNTIKSKRWPQGQPDQMVARSIERGTIWMKANPFVKRAVAKTRKAAIESMKKTVDEKIEDIMSR